MTIPIRPTNGGFLRPFGCAWFIIEFLKGNGPEDSKKIDPSAGAPMTDVHSEYKLALHRARSISFFKYFYFVKRLGFVEPTGREDESYIQGLTYADAPPCRYYRLSTKGKEAPEHEWYRPQLTLYPQFTPEYFAQKNTERRQNNKAA